MRFLNTTISQGSVATHLRRGGAFNYFVTRNLLLSLTMKEFWKLASIWQSYRQNRVVPFFTLRPILAFSYIGSVTARHSSSGASAKLCGVVQGMELRNVRSPVLTITARLRVRRPCIVAEKVASFFTSRNWTKITTRATFSPFAQPALNRGQPNFLPKIFAHVVRECAMFC